MIRVEKKTQNMKVIAEKFSGVNDFLDTYENAPISEPWSRDYTAKTLQDADYGSNKDFNGVSGYPEAVDQLRNGVNVDAIKSARAAAATGTKKQIQKSVYGGRVSVPSYLSGSPACMRRRATVPAKEGLDVVIDMGVPCMYSAEDVKKAGQKIVEYITQLEDRYNVNLTAATCTSPSRSCKKAYIMAIKIKDAGKPFSAARVSFCITSAAYNRVFSFIWRSRAEGIEYMENYGISTSRANMDREREAINAIYKNAIVVSVTDVIENGENAFPTLK